MKRVGAMASSVLLTMSWCYGQTAVPAPSQSGDAAQASAPAIAPQNIGHGAFPVNVTKPLDSSKLKEGDIIEFTTAGIFALPDGTRIPEKTKVIGHVTDAKARSKGDSQSELGIVFDQIRLANNQQLTIKAAVGAVGQNPYPDVPGVASGPSMAKQNGPGGAGFTPTTDIKYGSNMNVKDESSPMVTPQSTGVHGIHGLQLRPDGVLTSDGKHVKLDTGMQIIVRGEILK